MSFHVEANVNPCRFRVMLCGSEDPWSFRIESEVIPHWFHVCSAQSAVPCRIESSVALHRILNHSEPNARRTESHVAQSARVFRQESCLNPHKIQKMQYRFAVPMVMPHRIPNVMPHRTKGFSVLNPRSFRIESECFLAESSLHGPSPVDARAKGK